MVNNYGMFDNATFHLRKGSPYIEHFTQEYGIKIKYKYNGHTLRF